jgi:NET1-associated nuclear protein 1 (U3 small nucleolar RNA-associated protein 17)
MVTTGGCNLVSSQPAFSNDGKKLLVCTGNTVSVYSVATGMLVSLFLLLFHSHPICSSVNDEYHLQCYFLATKKTF